MTYQRKCEIIHNIVKSKYTISKLFKQSEIYSFDLILKADPISKRAVVQQIDINIKCDIKAILKTVEMIINRTGVTNICDICLDTVCIQISCNECRNCCCFNCVAKITRRGDGIFTCPFCRCQTGEYRTEDQTEEFLDFWHDELQESLTESIKEMERPTVAIKKITVA